MAASKAAATQPIIIIKRYSGHGGHHGGAWKVAYADFVTAMMALFIVLWLLSTSSAKVKKAVAGYFNDPKGTGAQLGTTMTGTGEGTGAAPTASNNKLEELKKKLEEEIKAKKELKDLSKQIEITITSEGLRIELIEGKNGTFYEMGSAKLSTNGQTLLALLGKQLKSFTNSLLIEGHTDATPYSSNSGYSNWELSADRANSARRLLQQDGVRTDQVMQVRGYADQMLRVKNNPTDPSNRRISILVTNDDNNVPEISAEKVVSGSSPLSKPGQKETPTAKPTTEKPAAEKPATEKTSAEKPAAPAPETKAATPSPAPTPTPAPTKPSAATPAPKTGMMDRIKAMLPGAKKK